MIRVAAHSRDLLREKDRQAVLDGMSKMRDVAINAKTQCKPFGTDYKLLHEVTELQQRIAEEWTGKRDYFNPAMPGMMSEAMGYKSGDE